MYIADEDGNVIYSSDEFKGTHMKKRSIPADPEAADGSHSRSPVKESDKSTVKSTYRRLPDDYEDMLELLKNSSDEKAESISEDFFIFGTYIDYYRYDSKVILYMLCRIQRRRRLYLLHRTGYLIIAGNP